MTRRKSPTLREQLATSAPSYTFEAYDVLQIESASGDWLDFATLRCDADAVRATQLVDTGSWEGKRESFRIVSNDCSRRVKYIAEQDEQRPTRATLIGPVVDDERDGLMVRNASDFADSLKQLLEDSDDFEFPCVERVETAAEACLLTQYPSSDALRVTLVNGAVITLRITTEG